MEFDRFPGRLLVISPHFDDACFSVGGLLSKKPAEDITILTVFSKTQHAPNYRFFHRFAQVFDILGIVFFKRKLTEVISLIRKNEDLQFCRQIGAKQCVLTFEDSALRKCDAYITVFGSEEHNNELISKQVFETLQKMLFSGNFESILCPLGIGNQIDHLVIVSAIIRIMKAKSLPLNIFFYEDLPYAAFDKIGLPHAIALERVSSEVNIMYIDVTMEIALKQMLIDIYRSQCPQKDLIVQHACRLFKSLSSTKDNIGYYERIWRFSTLSCVF